MDAQRSRPDAAPVRCRLRGEVVVTDVEMRHALGKPHHFGIAVAKCCRSTVEVYVDEPRPLAPIPQEVPLAAVDRRSTPESGPELGLVGFQNVFARSSTSVFDSDENVP